LSEQREQGTCDQYRKTIHGQSSENQIARHSCFSSLFTFGPATSYTQLGCGLFQLAKGVNRTAATGTPKVGLTLSLARARRRPRTRGHEGEDIEEQFETWNSCGVVPGGTRRTGRFIVNIEFTESTAEDTEIIRSETLWAWSAKAQAQASVPGIDVEKRWARYHDPRPRREGISLKKKVPLEPLKRVRLQVQNGSAHLNPISLGCGLLIYQPR